jgi:hypothetical protein
VAGELCAHLLASIRELLAGYEAVLGGAPPQAPPQAPAQPPPQAPAQPPPQPSAQSPPQPEQPVPPERPVPPEPPPPQRAPDRREATVLAGPFASASELHAFQHALAGLPGVVEVALRGYEGGHRAIIDVLFGPETS